MNESRIEVIPILQTENSYGVIIQPPELAAEGLCQALTAQRLHKDGTYRQLAESAFITHQDTDPEGYTALNLITGKRPVAEDAWQLEAWLRLLMDPDADQSDVVSANQLK